MFRSTNPVLTRMDNNDIPVLNSVPMTVNGTIGKTFVLILIALVAAAAIVYEAFMGYTDKMMMVLTISFFASIIIGLITCFAPKLAKFLSPVYAFAEGALLGGLSLLLETQFPGIALQAIAGTFIAFFTMLALYRAKVIKATEKFRSTIMTAMIAIVVLYVIDLICGFFNISIPFVSGNSPMALVFSGLVILVASLSFILDFDFIEKGAQNLLPKDYEWYAAFGLTVTLVWLYTEILRFLALLRSND